MPKSLLILLSLLNLVHGVILHQCTPFIKSASTHKPYINVTVGRLTSLLIYELGDIENTNIPIAPHGEAIKQYDFNFTLCGLQDLESGLCDESEFGQFTIVDVLRMEQPYLNRLLDVGSTTVFEVPYSGVWCTLSYQDDDVMLRYQAHYVQYFGYISLREYNTSQSLGVVIFLNIALLGYWAIHSYKKRPLETNGRQQVNVGTVLIMILSALCYHLFYKTYITLLSIGDGDGVALSRYRIITALMAAVALYPFFYSIFGIFRNSKTHDSSWSKGYRFELWLLVKVYFEYCYIRSRSDSSFFRSLSTLIIWAFIFEAYARSNEERKTPLFKKTKNILFIIPIALYFLQSIWDRFDSTTASWEYFRELEGNITQKSLFISDSERQVNDGLVYSLATNLQQFEFILIILGLIMIWRKVT